MERALGACAAAAAAAAAATPHPSPPGACPPGAVLVDGLCDVSGFRYELWCAARCVGACAAVTVVVPGPHAAVEKIGAGTRVIPPPAAAQGPPPRSPTTTATPPSPYGPPALAASLAARFETPDPANRWERPLVVVETGGGEAGATAAAAGLLPPAGGWEHFDWAAASTAPAPPAAPAGARAADARGTQLDGGWPLPAVAAAVAAYITGGRRGEATTPAATQPPARSALTPLASTAAARASGADALAALDATLQRMVVAVAGHAQGRLALDLETGGAAAVAREEEGGDARRPPATTTLALPRPPALAELRRHKRDFLRAVTGPLASLPADTPAAVRQFTAYLQRHVTDS